MNCELAQLWLAMGSDGRTGEGAEALDAHLRACPHCAAVASYDASLAAAMNAVPLPTGLHERLLKAASVRRGADFRRAVGRYFAIAATVLAALGVGAGTYWRTRPTLITDDLVYLREIERENPQETVQNWLVRKNLPATLPLDFEYRWHAFHGIGELGDTEVPVVVFRRDREFAQVYVLRDSDAKIAKLKDAQSSLCKVTILRVPGRPDLAYLIIHSTDNLDPFLKQKLDNLAG
jgi:hypothetical protein